MWKKMENFVRYTLVYVSDPCFLCTGIHAREWITPATVTYILNKLLTSQDPVIRDLAESFDYYVLPSVNPDGYVYTHTTVRFLCK
jgi:murein tripeptide amidase MpaA